MLRKAGKVKEKKVKEKIEKIKEKAERADIWISTVIYILIGLAVISALLIATRPKIEEAKDRYTINYMINALNSLNGLILDVNEMPGSARLFELKIAKGELRIKPQEDKVEWQLGTNFKFSELNQLISVGTVNLITTQEAGRFITKLFLNYTEPINITTAIDGEGNELILTQAPTPYKISIKNFGTPLGSVNNTILISA
ncbi:MAG: hypothetical protein QXS07_01295 [Candidatus Pacearchaeota archaeon]